MRFSGGRLPLWLGHRSRLLASARILGYPIDAGSLDQQVQAFLDTLHPAADTWKIRLLLSADGSLTLESAPLADTATPVLVALAHEALHTGLDAGRHPGRPGCTATDPAGRPAARNQKFWLGHKTTHRPWYEPAQAWLQAHPAYFDLVYLSPQGEISEGSRCNVYIQDTDGKWLTPQADCGLLPGVQRRQLLGQGLVHEASISLADWRAAAAWRVSNALRGWLDASPVAGPSQQQPSPWSP